MERLERDVYVYGSDNVSEIAHEVLVTWMVDNHLPNVFACGQWIGNATARYVAAATTILATCEIATELPLVRVYTNTECRAMHTAVYLS